MTKAINVLFLSHGGGPLPLLGDPGHHEMVDQLTETSGKIRRPSAILVISAHWEEPIPTVTAHPNPSLIYDYSGFPSEAYKIEYPCAGEPELAGQIFQALEQAGIPAQMDDQRGFDHGLFVPLKLMYPDADIPCVQLSLKSSLDATEHIAIGRALQALDYDGLLVIGSGLSFHNMPEFFGAGSAEADARNQAFQGWLLQTCTDPQLPETDRADRLAHWEQAPNARFCHPREEHLLPLHVCYGLAGKASDTYLSAHILGKASGLFYWPSNPTTDLRG